MIVRMSAEAITRAMLMMPSPRVSPQRCNDIHSVLPIHHRRSPQPPRPPRNNSRIIENKMTVIVGTCKQQAAARGNSDTSIIQRRTFATIFQLKLSPTGYMHFLDTSPLSSLFIDTRKGIVILEWHCVCLWHFCWEYSVRNIFRSEQIFYHWGCQSLVRAEGAMWQISPAAGVGWRRRTMLWWTDYFARRGNLALSSAGLGWAGLGWAGNSGTMTEQITQSYI